jgi:hypothetical protein
MARARRTVPALELGDGHEPVAILVDLVEDGRRRVLVGYGICTSGRALCAARARYPIGLQGGETPALRLRWTGWLGGRGRILLCPAGRLHGAVVRRDLPGQLGDLFGPGGRRGLLGCAPCWLHGWLDVLHLAGSILAASDV